MKPTQRKWWWRPFRTAAALAVPLLALGVAGFKWASNSGLNHEMDEIRAKGLPTNRKELDAWYAPVPEDENAGLKFLRAANAFVEPAKGSDPGDVDFREIPHGEALDAETVRNLEAHLAKNAETLRLMREAAKMQRSRYPIDLSDAPHIKITHLIRLKRLAQLARWEAVLQAERGDGADAAEALKDGFALAHTLAHEPMVISALVRIGCVTIEVYGMERVVNVAHFDETQLAALAAKLHEAASDSRPSLQRAFIGDRAFENTNRKLTFNEYDQLFTMGGLVPNTSGVPEVVRKIFYYGRRAVGMEDRDHTFYMRNIGRMIDAAELNSPELFRTSEAVADRISVELGEHPIAYEMSYFSLPASLRVPKKETLLTARLLCAEMALEIERWRRKNGGKLPREDELSSILKDYPRDPVDGAPLEFQPNGHGGYRVIAAAATAEERKGGVNLKSPGVGFSVEK